MRVSKHSEPFSATCRACELPAVLTLVELHWIGKTITISWRYGRTGTSLVYEQARVFNCIIGVTGDADADLSDLFLYNKRW
jgi:hypothetical protein